MIAPDTIITILNTHNLDDNTTYGTMQITTLILD